MLIAASLMAVVSTSCNSGNPESPEPKTAILPGPEKFSIAMNGDGKVKMIDVNLD